MAETSEFDYRYSEWLGILCGDTWPPTKAQEQMARDEAFAALDAIRNEVN